MERKASAAASATSPTSKSSTQSASSTLSADMLLLNLGIVYEILDECLEQGFPMMPSLAQLDLLVFGVPVTK
ncbi:hypothetical protein BG004_000140 [Podila humilis]|nr:hypothetical protein BG004_000140 [Podila humilis]